MFFFLNSTKGTDETKINEALTGCLFSVSVIKRGSIVITLPGEDIT